MVTFSFLVYIFPYGGRDIATIITFAWNLKVKQLKEHEKIQRLEDSEPITNCFVTIWYVTFGSLTIIDPRIFQLLITNIHVKGMNVLS